MDRAPPISGFTTQFTYVVLQGLIENYRKVHGAAPAFVMVTPPQLAMLHASMASRPQGVRRSLPQWRELARKGRLKVLSLLVRVVEPCDAQ